MQYINPIIPGFHPDPSICRVNDAYYLVVGGNFTGNFFALYTTGNGNVCKEIAHIGWVHYKAK